MLKDALAFMSEFYRFLAGLSITFWIFVKILNIYAEIIKLELKIVDF